MLEGFQKFDECENLLVTEEREIGHYGRESGDNECGRIGDRLHELALGQESVDSCIHPSLVFHCRNRMYYSFWIAPQ